MNLFSKIEEIIKDAKKGKMFILVDDENRENEGDLVVPAQKINAEKINFMAKHGRGLICLALSGKRIEELNLPLMPQHNTSRRKTAFTISIEAKKGISTGISAKDRAKTIQVAISNRKNSKDISTPGHIFPLRAQEGGVLVRAGHTEAAVDIANLANLNSSGVICEIMNDDGTMARRDDLFKFSKEHKLKMATISDLIFYRRKKEKIIERTLKTKIKSKYGGDFNLIVYKNKIVPAEHIALVKGKINPKKPVLVRVHALNFLTDILGTSSFIDNQIKKSMQMISKKKNGVVVIIREPRSWTLSQRIKSGSDDKKSSQLRDYGVGAQILIDLGVKNMILISNSKKPVLVRVHALNFLNDILGSASFVSDNQIKQAMKMISDNKNGIVVIIREPRSWSLSQRIKSNQDVKNNKQLRDYGVGAQILIDLGVKNMILISNSKKTIVGLEGYGLKITNTIPIK